MEGAGIWALRRGELRLSHHLGVDDPVGGDVSGDSCALCGLDAGGEGMRNAVGVDEEARGGDAVLMGQPSQVAGQRPCKWP
jgi:hypothetical protein